MCSIFTFFSVAGSSRQSDASFYVESISRQDDYIKILKETNSLLREISLSLSNFVNVFAAVNNVKLITEEELENSKKTEEEL